jgi:hypothetical protein
MVTASSPPHCHRASAAFQPDFALRWLKAAATSYVVIVPVLIIVIPPIRRFVMRQAGLPTR